MTIYFASYKGSMLRYFEEIASKLPHLSPNNFNCRLLPYSFLSVFWLWTKHDLTEQEISQGITFELQRKQRKYYYIRALWPLYRYFLRLSFISYYNRFSDLFYKEPPDFICLWNGHRLPEYAIKLIAEKRNISVAHFENGLLPNTTTFDFCGVNDKNCLPRNKTFYQNYQPRSTLDTMPIKQRNSNSNKIRHASKKRFFDPLPKTFIYVPFQVNFDSQILLNSPWVTSMEALYCLLDKLTLHPSLSEYYFVIKEHPSDSRKYDELYDSNSRVLFRNFSSQELTLKSSGVMTINSTVGLEALILDKKVIVLGNACFAIEDMVLHARNYGELEQAVLALKTWTPDSNLRVNFLSYLKEEYCIPDSWRSPSDHHFTTLAKKLTTFSESTFQTT